MMLTLLSPLPQGRAAAVGTLIVTGGTNWRHRIEDDDAERR
jgi:hypothetical protein